MSQRVWFFGRLVVLVVCFLGGLLGDQRQEFQQPLTLNLVAYLFFFTTFGMLFVIGLQRWNPRSAAVWRYPSWSSNPFTSREPLQFFWFGGSFLLASGMGAMVRDLLSKPAPLFESGMLVTFGTGTLVGVWLCTVVFRGKMERASGLRKEEVIGS